MKSLPEKFAAKLVGEYENCVPVFPVTVIEDPKTRETVFYNAEGKAIYSLPPATGYDPFAYLKERWPWLYSGKASWQAATYWQSIFDPARVQLRTKLIPTEYVEAYLYVSERIAEEAALAAALEGGGGGMMMLMGGESGSNIVFTAMRWTNGVLARIAYPEDFTNRLDVFTCNDLLSEIWSFAVREPPTSGTNQITWVDTNSWVGGGWSHAYDARDFVVRRVAASTNAYIYGYDDQGRLIEAIGLSGTNRVSGYPFRYRYDRMGNRSEQTEGTQQNMLRYNRNNQLIQRGRTNAVRVRGWVNEAGTVELRSDTATNWVPALTRFLHATQTWFEGNVTATNWGWA